MPSWQWLAMIYQSEEMYSHIISVVESMNMFSHMHCSSFYRNYFFIGSVFSTGDIMLYNCRLSIAMILPFIF